MTKSEGERRDWKKGVGAGGKRRRRETEEEVEEGAGEKWRDR